jgi:hypothetical protein
LSGNMTEKFLDSTHMARTLKRKIISPFKVISIWDVTWGWMIKLFYHPCSSSGITVLGRPQPLPKLPFFPVSNFRNFSTEHIFHGVGVFPHVQPRTWRARVSLFVWVITFDVSGVEGLISRYASASVALGIIRPLQPCCFVTARIYSGDFIIQHQVISQRQIGQCTGHFTNTWKEDVIEETNTVFGPPYWGIKSGKKFQETFFLQPSRERIPVIK